MTTLAYPLARKRPVNLTLNEDLVRHARQLTNNLSGVVETLLTDFVDSELQRRRAQSQQVATTIALWNDFEERHGAFADEYSTL
ncbi:MAG: plasmid maintenance protein CcdB [Methylococcaceae bacterium]|nr:MAG: plasmid maintenance protein CcdB [Methylococcaceae bacterium]